MRLAPLFVAFLMTASTFSAAAAEPIKELNISYVKPPFVLQLLVMKDHKLLEKEFQADGIKINWHNMARVLKPLGLWVRGAWTLPAT